MMEQIVVLLVDLGQTLAYVPLLTTKVETLIPFWAIFDALAHLTFALAWEKWVVSY
jgi:hypothetical protein